MNLYNGWINSGKRFFEFRKSLYASVNGKKDNLIKLSKSNLLRKNEKKKLDEVIQKITELSSIIKQNNTPPNFGKE